MMEDIAISTEPSNISQWTTVPLTKQTPNENYYIAVAFCAIALLGIPGNGLVMIAVCVSRSLQTPTNAFLTSLGVADLLTCVILPLQAAAMIQGAEGSLVPSWLCTGMAYVACVCNISSVLHLLVIAVTRCIFLSNNNAIKYAHLRNKRNVTILITIAWVLPCAVYFVPITLGIRRLGYHNGLKICLFLEEVNTVTRVYVAMVILTYSITLCTIVICHLKIFFTIHKQHSRLSSFGEVGERPPSVKQRESNGNPHKDANYESESDLEEQRLTSIYDFARDRIKSLDRRRQSVSSHISTIIARQFEITKYLIYVVIAFIVCVMPTCFCLTTSKCYNNYLSYMLIPLFFNSCVNPFIYSLKDRNFHVVFVAILKCRLSGESRLNSSSQGRRRYEQEHERKYSLHDCVKPQGFT